MSYPCPVDFSVKINSLLNNTEMWDGFSERARQRAEKFTWHETAERIVKIVREAPSEEEVNQSEQALECVRANTIRKR